jgi:hypothetical protein
MRETEPLRAEHAQLLPRLYSRSEGALAVESRDDEVPGRSGYRPGLFAFLSHTPRLRIRPCTTRGAVTPWCRGSPPGSSGELAGMPACGRSNVLRAISADKRSVVSSAPDDQSVKCLRRRGVDRRRKSRPSRSLLPQPAGSRLGPVARRQGRHSAHPSGPVPAAPPRT